MRWRASSGWRFALIAAVVLLALPVTLPDEAGAEDVEISTTFLTFFKNGGGYIEYSIKGSAAAELRGLIDDPDHMFPFETIQADGDGQVDQAEGERYMTNLDNLLTNRQIVLRGVKMDNVDVDDHRGIIGSEVNDTDELYLHITFRGHLQYNEEEFNVSGLEPLMVLYGEYEEIPSTLTVDERTYIVSAGLASYRTETRGEGSLFNLRVPMAAVVSFHDSYTVASPPSNRMSYDHSTVVGNPLVLMLLILFVSVLAIKLPKGLARDNGKERVRELHLGILVALVLFWAFYVLGGAAPLVWAFGVALVAGSYYMAHLIYVRDWRGMAEPAEGIDMGEGIAPVEPNSAGASNTLAVHPGEGLLGREAGPVEAYSPDEVLLVLPEEETSAPPYPAPQGVVHSHAAYHMPRPGPTPQQPPPSPQAPVEPAPMPPVQQQGSHQQAPQHLVTPSEVPPAPGTKTMRCKCGGTFTVPLQPRPLTVQCPHCSTTGTLR